MPKVASSNPDSLRPYIFQGIDLNWRDGGKEAIGDCPFCGRESKFSVNIKTGLYRCLICAEGTEKGGGNSRVFIRKFWDLCSQKTTDYEGLAKDRGFLYPDVLIHWEVVRSVLTQNWLIPGYGAEKNLNQLYSYRLVDGRMRLLPTPTLHHQLHGVNLYDPSKPVVYLCEGPWDGMAWWETLSQAKIMDDGSLSSTSNMSRSLLAEANVLAVPGANVFLESWLPLFSGKTVVLLYDSDHSRKAPNGKIVEGAGYVGMMRVADILAKAEEPPEEIRYLAWGPNGYDPEKPSGYDLRDALTSSGTALASRINAATEILGRLAVYESEALKTNRNRKSAGKGSSSGMEVIPCSEYRELISAWRKAMKWTPGLDHALSVMLSSIISTKSVGDQLWVKVIGPAACGKSTLCEAVSTSKYVLAKSTIRGFHSGFGSGGEDEDNSLLALVKDKTLVTKDGDTLLQSPNMSQILSEARDVYDRVSRTHYRNRNSRDYAGINMTWILCGTSSLRSIDSSELGERFLDCVIMEGIDDDLEDEILWRVANRAERNLAIEADGKAETHQEPEMTLVMQLTGGYVNYLRENATEILSTITMDDWAKRLCTRLGKFVAYMRARPSKRQDETAEREFAARLVSQHIRLAKCLAAVINRNAVDESVMERTRKVALDTSRGQTLDIVRYLYQSGEDGLTPQAIAIFTNRPTEKTTPMLRFLRQIGVVEPYTPKSVKGISKKPAYRLTQRIRKLYAEVYGVDPEYAQEEII